ncbi:kinesin-like protein KIF18A [Battus philenor]|uniref:kinesin-like protein KIF18A n=1 Tax=Battus philenor TaxID=42288 RepID=UPI0035CF87E5
MVNMVKGPSRPPGSAPATLVPSRSGSTQNTSANVKVVVRVRPLNEKELEQNSRIVVDVVDDNMLVFDPKEEMRPFFYHGVQQPTKNYLKRANKELKFVFDNVCGQNATNQEVFETTTKEILAALMEGYNCSVFAYGATGAGKTFTMIGNEEHPGITYLTMEHLFNTINSFEKDREFDIGVSYIEVYNENVYDLLEPSSTPLQLREDSKYGVMVAGLTLNNIKTARELLNMLENGNKNRTQHPTDANAESSRSHAVFQVYVKMRYKTSSQLRIVKLSMIDLAGSERASATGCVGDRFKEGANINKSLLSLGNCINKLADGSSYIPYRDSKLTRLLKDSLGGNCKTVMIANISPSGASYEDTYNTLKYAARANKIQLKIKKNIVDGNMRPSQYVKINEELKKRVIELEAKLSLCVDTTKEKLKVDWRRRMTEAEALHGALENELLTLMVRQRVLALRHKYRTDAFSHVADLAHRSSSDALEQVCTEEIPRRERAAENYQKQTKSLDAKIKVTWAKWKESQKKVQEIFSEVVTECPDLLVLVEKMKLQSEMRLIKARDDLRYKLLCINNRENNASKTCLDDMSGMLKKVYLTLKGYNLAPPTLTAEYLEIIKKLKHSKAINWSDEDDEIDDQFKFVSTLDLNNPMLHMNREGFNTTVEITSDSEDLTDIENKNPLIRSTNKRGDTPIKLANNETILINDSFELLDTLSNLNSIKKMKMSHNAELDVENFGAGELNSTFVLAGKTESKPLQIKTENIKIEGNVPMKRKLADATNTMQKSLSFNNKDNKLVKPVVGKALPVRRVPPTMSQGRPTPGFGSSLSRDGTPLQKNIQGPGRGTACDTQRSVGYKAVRARSRVQSHPYSRPLPIADRRL